MTFIDTLRSCMSLIAAAERRRWLSVLAMAVAVSAFEAAGTLLVFVLLGLLVGGDEARSLPVVSWIHDVAPGLAHAQLLTAVALGVGFFFLLRAVVIGVQSYIQYRVAETTGARLSTELLQGYMSMPYEFHLQRNSSESIRNAFDSVRRFVEEGLVPGVKMIARLSVVLGILAVLLWVSPIALMLVAVVLGPALWFVLKVVQPRVKEFGVTAQRISKKNLQSLQQSLEGWRDIRLLGREADFVGEYNRDRQALARSRYLQRTTAEFPRIAIETTVVLFLAGFIAITSVAGGAIIEVASLLGLFGYAAVRLIPELNHVMAGLHYMKFVGPALVSIDQDLRAFEIERSRGHEDVEQGTTQALPLTKELILHRVHYAYPGAASEALQDVSLRVSVGESMGIVGPSGGGKTTLVDIVLGLLAPTKGIVTVDGIDIATRRRAWQSRLGVVHQVVFLTDDTVRRNVALGVPDEEIDDDAIWTALAMAQLEDFVRALPGGLGAQIGERGTRLSGGQRQRLAIARALYRRPDVVLFDEGTSALDNETEAAVVAALRRLRGTRTLITVAHRLTTVQFCDRIIVVRGGQVVDQGPYAELAQRHASLRVGSTP